MKKIISIYLIFSLNFISFEEIIRIVLNKSYKKYYNLELSNEELSEMKLDLNINYLDYGIEKLNPRDNTDIIVIHHSARTIWSPEDINDFHKSKGWDGIGYNFYIRKDGTIYNGRGEEIVGAQLKGYNDISIGICLEGNFEIEEPEEGQIEALNNLIYYLICKYDIKKIKGHKDYAETLCPGKNLNIKLIKEELIKEFS